MAIHETIRALGNSIAQHHFCGAYDGVAAVLCTVDGSTIGTHFAAMVQADGNCHILPITNEVLARAAYRALIDGVHAAQDAA